MSNQKDIAKKIRREALKKNWRLFRRSKLGMIGLYIVIFFLFYLSLVFGIKEHMIQL